MERTGNGVIHPSLGWFALLDGGIVVLTALSLSERSYREAARRLLLPPRWVLRRLLVAAGVIHVAEAVYAGRTARRVGLPVGGWALQTLVVGFPSLGALRRVASTESKVA